MRAVLSRVWYPAFMAGAIVAFLALLAAGAGAPGAALVPVVIAGLSILALETRFFDRREWKPTRADVQADAAFMAFVMVALPRVLGFAAVTAIAQWRHARDAAALWPHEWPLLAQVALVVLVVDLARYWLHRACHRFTPLWRLHEVHHSPERLYVVNVGRFHPLEKALHFTLDTVPFLALGVAPEVMAGYFVVYSVNGFFQHSNLDLRYGWLNYVVGSAETHRWHHARDAKAAACNFGSTTVIWDVVFGTWRLPGRAGEVGIEDREYPKGFMAQMTAPFRRQDGLPRRSERAFVADLLVVARLRSMAIAAAWRVARMSRDPMRVQHRLLARIVRDNRETAFGRAHGFERIDGYDTFAAWVPVAEFEQLRPLVDAEIANGDRSLTRAAPVRYVRTSGTTGVPKDIPLVARHLEALRRIHESAVAFQYRACPAAFSGGIFAMVSPAFEGVLANGKPFGSASGIVAGNTPQYVREKFVVPPEVLAIGESRVKYLLSLRLAIARRDLSYLGAANPSTILALLKLYREHQAQLLSDLERGTFFLADRVPASLMEALRGRLRADPRRARELRALRRVHPSPGLAQVWPRLRLVVTWTCASAGVAAAALKGEIGAGVRMMELGYVSSEFRGTITLGKRRGSGMPTIDTHFFEFVEREAWDRGERRYLTLDGLAKGRDYYVLVTTPSGLYRYFINDIVRVTGFLHALPLLRFVQKGKGVTSITGEKLYEAQLLDAVRFAMHASGRETRFVMALADEEASTYRVYIEGEGGSRPDAGDLARAIDARLSVLNVEYAAKRESARLRPLEVRWLAGDTGERYKAHCVARGQREGQFKMVALDYRGRFGFDLDACVAP